MARFWQTRPTRLIDTFVPLPVNYLMQQRDKTDKRINDLNTEAEQVGMMQGLNYIPFDQRDKEYAKKYNDEKLAYAQKATESLDFTKMNGKNLQEKLNEATSYIKKAKMLEVRKKTQGTREYEIENAYKNWTEDWEDIRKSKHKNDVVRQGIYNFQMKQYANREDVMGGYKKFNDYDYYDREKLFAKMDKIAVDKAGYTKLFGDGAWDVRNHITSENRTKFDLFVKGRQLMEGMPEMKDYFKSEIKYKYEGGAYGQPGSQEAVNRYHREMDAVETGGLSTKYYADMPERKNYKTEADYRTALNKHTSKMLNYLDYGTEIGSLLYGNADALKVHNYDSVKSRKLDPLGAYGTAELRGGNTTAVVEEGVTKEVTYDPNKLKTDIVNHMERGDVTGLKTDAINAVIALNSKISTQDAGKGFDDYVADMKDVGGAELNDMIQKLGFDPSSDEDFKRGVALLTTTGKIADMSIGTSVSNNFWTRSLDKINKGSSAFTGGGNTGIPNFNNGTLTSSYKGDKLENVTGKYGITDYWKSKDKFTEYVPADNVVFGSMGKEVKDAKANLLKYYNGVGGSAIGLQPGEKAGDIGLQTTNGVLSMAIHKTGGTNDDKYIVPLTLNIMNQNEGAKRYVTTVYKNLTNTFTYGTHLTPDEIQQTASTADFVGGGVLAGDALKNTKFSDLKRGQIIKTPMFNGNSIPDYEVKLAPNGRDVRLYDKVHKKFIKGTKNNDVFHNNAEIVNAIGKANRDILVAKYANTSN